MLLSEAQTFEVIQIDQRVVALVTFQERQKPQACCFVVHSKRVAFQRRE